MSLSWNEIEKKYKSYNELGLREMLDYKKYYIYSIIAHSTALEGSTLTEKDTKLLFDEGITVAGKSMNEHLMNIDLKKAYEYAVKESGLNTAISPEFLKKLNALVMTNAGAEYNTAMGTFDSSKGEYRLFGVTAGLGGSSYMNYQKVPGKVDALCNELNKKLESASSLKEIYNLSFDAHLNLVTIHPWADGNGRASRLLKNYIQFRNNLVPTKVYKEDKAAYIDSLEQSRENESPAPFREFMAEQLMKTLKSEIRNYSQRQKKMNNLKFLF